MPSNERVQQYLDLRAALVAMRYANPAEVSARINMFVDQGGMVSDSIMWDHTNASIAGNPDALVNLLDEACAVGRVLQDRELAREAARGAAECRCGAAIKGDTCTSDPTPPRCHRCRHALSHGACPLCSPRHFFEQTGYTR